MAAPILTLAQVRKSFDGARALIDANLALYPGEVTALIGENGAGKSTLVKILSGVHQPDAGDIRVAQQPVRIESVESARKLGINVVHQECVIFDNLSVAENIFIHARLKRRRMVAWDEMRRRAASLLHQLDARFDPDMPAARLSVAQKHIVQIARALTGEARVMIMDEPTAALAHGEVEELFRIVRRLKDAGCAVLFISHKFEEVFAIADRYTVFRDGASVGDGLTGSTDREALIRLMVGRNVEQSPEVRTATPGAELLRVESLSRAREFENISFAVRRNEVLGIYGLVGSGRTELAQSLFGLQPADSGELFLDGQRVSFRSPADALAHGLAYVPEDRQQQGAILPFSIAANIALPNLEQLSSRGLLNRAREDQLARHWIGALGVKAHGPTQAVAELSGGNQQKVVLAKWLARQPSVLILDEPTKGVDVGAKLAMHAVTREFARRGNAVILISSELPEILDLSDRILVMRRGHGTALMSRSEASAEAIVSAATDA